MRGPLEPELIYEAMKLLVADFQRQAADEEPRSVGIIKNFVMTIRFTTQRCSSAMRSNRARPFWGDVHLTSAHHNLLVQLVTELSALGTIDGSYVSQLQSFEIQLASSSPCKRCFVGILFLPKLPLEAMPR